MKGNAKRNKMIFSQKIEHNTKLVFLSANKDEIAMKNSAEKRIGKKENEWIKKTRKENENYNTIICFAFYE